MLTDIKRMKGVKDSGQIILSFCSPYIWEGEVNEGRGTGRGRRSQSSTRASSASCNDVPRNRFC